jgi:small subunit ribosomal protein S21
MKKRRNFRKKPKDNSIGLSVKVYNNNVDGALRVLKKKIKASNLFLDLRKKEYFEKPSETKRHKRNLAKLRNKYAIQKEKEKSNY